ncbi:MAG TPA: hypothetical protein VFO84_10560 [Dehalococcoidia bacterium]|nr:hypothetical protein [Dehalococcoidia bacterium]
MRTLTVEASQPDAEKACLMTADQGQRRQGDLDSLFSKVVKNTPIEDGQVLRLQGDRDDLWQKVLAFIEEEKVCCPFFSFEARELPDGVELTISGARLGEIQRP